MTTPLPRPVSAVVSHIGGRSGNEDAAVAQDPVFAVADGMGGHAAGEVASRLAVEELTRLSALTELGADDVREAVAAANRRIAEAARSNPEQRGMGTTAVGVVAVDHDDVPSWAGFNVGDSRLYRWSDDRLEQLSTDHSEVQELVDAGVIRPQEARQHPRRNVITRSLGHDDDVPVDLWTSPRRTGEWFLACTDGLSDVLDDEEIAEVLRRSLTGPDDVRLAAEALVGAALDAGTSDNVTVLLVGLPG